MSTSSTITTPLLSSNSFTYIKHAVTELQFNFPKVKTLKFWMPWFIENVCGFLKSNSGIYLIKIVSIYHKFFLDLSEIIAFFIVLILKQCTD